MAILSKTAGDAQFPPAKPNLILPLNTLELLSQLLQQTTQGLKTILITEDILATTQSHKFPDLKFTVVISEEFNGLLWGTIAKESLDNQIQKIEDRQKDNNSQSNPFTFPFSSENVGNLKFNVGLTFDPETIKLFVYQVLSTIEEDNSNLAIASQIKSKISNLKVNNTNLQDEFTLKLLKLLTYHENIDSILEQTSSQKINKNKSYSQKSNFLSIDDSKVDIYGLSGPDSTLNNQQYPLVCQPIEQALSKQLEQEILLNQVTTKISQNFELPEILSTTVEQVQKLIKVDRFLIYQFNNPLSLTNNVTSENQRKGYVQYEALASENISSVLGLTEEENCFYLPHNSIARYSKVYVHAITDIEVVYGQFPCLVELMQQHQVKAKLVVPIIVDRQLWGLLIAHHCSIREWQDNEKDLSKKLQNT